MTTLTELGEMLIEVDKGRELEVNGTVIYGREYLGSEPISELLKYQLRLKPVPVKTYYRLYEILQLRAITIRDYATSSEPFEEFSIWAKDVAIRENRTNVRNIIHVEDFVKED